MYYRWTTAGAEEGKMGTEEVLVIVELVVAAVTKELFYPNYSEVQRDSGDSADSALEECAGPNYFAQEEEGDQIGMKKEVEDVDVVDSHIGLVEIGLVVEIVVAVEAHDLAALDPLAERHKGRIRKYRVRTEAGATLEESESMRVGE